MTALLPAAPASTPLLASWPAPECWLDTDETELVCRAVLDVTHNVKSFCLASPDGSVFAFEPGQFVTLELEIDGQSISRCYTISSPPTRPHLLSITVKRVTGGPVSNWLHDTMAPGARLRVRAPLGGFTLRAPVAARYLFLSAGSGITPLMSMTRTLADLGSDADVLFVHSARTPADIVFRRELDAITAVHPNIRVAYVCEADHETERWQGLRGRLSAAVLMAMAPDVHERVTYTCGPAPYMASVRTILTELGCDLASYHEESFTFETVVAALGADADAPGTDADDDSGIVTHSVELVRSGVTLRCGATQTILDAAYAAGVRVPASCTQGMCGTCKSSKLSGEVDMQHNGGIRPREIAQGKILLCCSTPLGDVRIDA